MKPKEEQVVDENVDTLRDDILRVRDDLGNLMRSLQYRGRNLAASGRNRVRTMVSAPSEHPEEEIVEEVEEPELETQRVPITVRSRLLAGAIVAVFALGTAAIMLLMRRRFVEISELPQAEERQRRSRLEALRPWGDRFRNLAVETARRRPHLRVPRSRSSDVEQEEMKVEERPER